MSDENDRMMDDETLIGYYRRLKNRYAINKHRATTPAGKAKNEWLIEECYALIRVEWKRFECPAMAFMLFHQAEREGGRV